MPTVSGGSDDGRDAAVETFQSIQQRLNDRGEIASDHDDEFVPTQKVMRWQLSFSETAGRRKTITILNINESPIPNIIHIERYIIINCSQRIIIIIGKLHSVFPT